MECKDRYNGGIKELDLATAQQLIRDQLQATLFHVDRRDDGFTLTYRREHFCFDLLVFDGELVDAIYCVFYFGRPIYHNRTIPGWAPEWAVGMNLNYPFPG
jgi:hypothetical protein